MWQRLTGALCLPSAGYTYHLDAKCRLYLPPFLPSAGHTYHMCRSYLPPFLPSAGYTYHLFCQAPVTPTTLFTKCRLYLPLSAGHTYHLFCQVPVIPTTLMLYISTVCFFYTISIPLIPSAGYTYHFGNGVITTSTFCSWPNMCSTAWWRHFVFITASLVCGFLLPVEACWCL